VSGNDGLRAFRKEADKMLSREARLEDMEVVARLLAEVAALRAKAAAVDRVRKLIAFYDRHEYSSLVVDDLRRALDGPPC
jgi:hypothetical protein